MPRPLAEGLAAIDTRVNRAVPTSGPAPAPDVTPPAPDVTPQADAIPEPASELSPAPTPAPAPAPAPENGEHTPVPDPPLARRRAAAGSGATRAPSRQTRGDWVVEMWVDPEWFAAQETGEDSPSPGVPDVVRLTGRSLIGRYSASRRVVPEVDCGADSGVSRRHAEFTTDGTRWWVEDVGSSNGTFVGPARGPLPELPIPPGQRVEVSVDDRIYVGAWTRLVVRHATASDLAGTG
ncbi:MAG: FHA domain-containing protein [Dermatophilaceae bacterium]